MPPRSEPDDPAIIKTYRYLRLAMVVLVIGIFAAILLVTEPQSSISHYYYTPARDTFVAALLAVGVCLICIRGGTATEDALLNIAGALALIVALVPVDTATEARALGVGADDRVQAVITNFQAYLVMGGFAAAVLVGLTVWARLSGRGSVTGGDVVGFLVAVVLVGGFAWWFFHRRESFLDDAHNWAAVGMFGCIAAVAIIDGLHARNAQRAPKRGWTYVLIGVAMVAAAAGISLWSRFVAPLANEVLLIETALIVLFAVFWAMQTVDLWQAGSRDRAIERHQRSDRPDPL
jgi:drug/metabolite transporter (DMT)-like permease